MIFRLLSILSIHLLALTVGLAPVAFAESVSNTVTLSAVILSKSNCQFNNPGSASLNFGVLDPLNPVDVSVSATLGFVCRGSSAIATYLISDDDGLHETVADSPRMQHDTNLSAYLPYEIILNPASGSAPKNVDQTLTVTGTAYGADYQSAIAGNYSDLVTISIQP